MALVLQECGDLVAVLDGARAIENRAAATAEQDFIGSSDFVCDREAGTFSISLTNGSEVAIGMNSNVTVGVPAAIDLGEEGVTQSEPLVDWRIEPGATWRIEGTLGRPGLGGDCVFNGSAFDADPTNADAAGSASTDPALTGDDPTVWFPELLAKEIAGRGSGDSDAASVTEDVRSFVYGGVLDSTATGAADTRSLTSVNVCAGSIRQLDPDRLAFAYHAVYTAGTAQTEDGPIEIPASDSLSVGVFRRGSDGQWRWLGRAVSFNSPNYEACRLGSG